MTLVLKQQKPFTQKANNLNQKDKIPKAKQTKEKTNKITNQMDIYSNSNKNFISELKIICFQIKEDLTKQKMEIQKFREQIYNHFNAQCKDFEFSNMREDADFLLHERRNLSSKQNLNPQDNHFFEISISRLLKYKLNFAEKNSIINVFIQQSKQQANNSFSLNKKLISNMDFIRKELFKYFNQFNEE